MVARYAEVGVPQASEMGKSDHTRLLTSCDSFANGRLGDIFDDVAFWSRASSDAPGKGSFPAIMCSLYARPPLSATLGKTVDKYPSETLYG